MGVAYNSRIITDGLVLALDAANPKSYPTKNFVSSKIYSSFGGSIRSSNYTVQYSDDNSNWTTAFTGVASNNTSCGIQQNTGSGSGSYGLHRYWRYVEGSPIQSHHPRVSRIILTDINGIDYNLVVYTSDNCSDTGTYQVGTVSLDFGGTTWTDLSTNGNTGELLNGTGYSSSNRGALTFDGSNQRVLQSSATINFSGGSMEVWAYFNNFNGNQGVFSMSSNPTYINFYIPTSRLMRWEVIGNAGSAYSTISSTYVIEPSTWYHFVGTFGEGNTTKLYINGVLNNSQSSYTNVPSNFTSAIILGEYAGYLNGRISNAKIYNRALTAAEIQQNYNALRGRFGSDDPGNGQGYSIAQSASSTNGVYTSTSSTNYISSWYLSAGGNGTPLNYTCSGSGANFAYHTGHNGNSSQWPMYHAIQVSTNTYGQVINRINWYKHTNACGNVDIWGTTRAITSQNYTDTSLYTYLGRVNMGGYGSAGDCNVSSGTFNSSSYGYNWILLQVQDISGALSYPSVGTLGGWAMYGMQLVKQ